MSRILLVALATYRETVRRRVFLAAVGFSFLIFFAPLLAIPLASGQKETLVKDIGLSFINIFGILLAVLMSTSLLHDEIDRRTVYTILARPIRRRDYVIGKYLGLLLMSAANIGIMAAAFLAILGVSLGRIELPLLASVVLSFLEVAVVTAVALLLTTVSTPLLAACATLLFCVAGHFVGDLSAFGEHFAGPASRAALSAVSLLLPNLENFNAKGELVYGSGVSLQFLALSASYAACYAVLLLFLSALLFERREFK